MLLTVLAFLFCVVPIRILSFRFFRRNRLWYMDLLLNYCIIFASIDILSRIENFSSYSSKCILVLFLFWGFMEVVLCILNSSLLIKWLIKQRGTLNRKK